MNLALLKFAGAVQPVSIQLEYFRHADRPIGAAIGDFLAGAASALKSWQSGVIDATGLRQKLAETEARGRLAELSFPAPPSHSIAPRRTVAVFADAELLAALGAYAEAYETCISGKTPVPGRIPFTPANDLIAALWTGLRAASRWSSSAGSGSSAPGPTDRRRLS